MVVYYRILTVTRATDNAEDRHNQLLDKPRLTDPYST